MADHLEKEFHVCPWWLAYTFDNPLRRIIQNPDKILKGLVTAGQTVIDIGCGMGYYSLALARMVGEQGLVISVDLQEKMLQKVQKRAAQAGLLTRIRLHQAQSDKLGVREPADFILAFWMVHEVPHQAAFFKEVYNLLKPHACFLMVEPKLHVSAADFQKTLDLALSLGFKLDTQPKISISRTALLRS